MHFQHFAAGKSCCNYSAPVVPEDLCTQCIKSYLPNCLMFFFLSFLRNYIVFRNESLHVVALVGSTCTGYEPVLWCSKSFQACCHFSRHMPASSLSHTVSAIVLAMSVPERPRHVRPTYLKVCRGYLVAIGDRVPWQFGSHRTQTANRCLLASFCWLGGFWWSLSRGRGSACFGFVCLLPSAVRPARACHK